jgi:hypothetical protein
MELETFRMFFFHQHIIFCENMTRKLDSFLRSFMENEPILSPKLLELFSIKCFMFRQFPSLNILQFISGIERVIDMIR